MIINTSLCNGYILDMRENEFVVFDIAGESFEFDLLEKAIQFMYQAKSYDNSRIEIYEKLK